MSDGTRVNGTAKPKPGEETATGPKIRGENPNSFNQ